MKNFGEAVEALKQGKLVRRKNWSKNENFVFRQVPAEIPDTVVPKMTSLPEKVKEKFSHIWAIQRINSIQYHNQMALVQEGGFITSYNPTTVDIFAEDWEILN